MDFEEFKLYVDNLEEITDESFQIAYMNNIKNPNLQTDDLRIFKEKALKAGMSEDEYQIRLDANIERAKIGFSEFMERRFDSFNPFRPPDNSNLPTFPIECLPTVLHEFACAMAESFQISIDMAACEVLGIMSVCVQNKYIIEVKPDWCEQLNLFILTIAAPSERKSPTLAIALKPLREYEQEKNEQLAPAIDEYQIKKRILTKQLDNMKESAAKTLKARKKGGSASFASSALDDEVKEIDTIADILEKQKELRILEPVTPFRLLADDVTVEKLTSLLSENNGSISIISAEGGIFTVLAGLYSSKVNIDPVLKAYTGDSILIDRLGRASETINHPTLTMSLMVQPTVINDIMNNQEFVGRGLTARFLYSYPISMVGKGRKYHTTPIPFIVSQNYSNLIRSLLDLPNSRDCIFLSAEADNECEKLFDELEEMISNELDSMEAWGGKLMGQVVRIAGIIHCCIHKERSAIELVSGTTLKNAVTIGKYFIEHAKIIFKLMGYDELQEEKEARYILKRLLSTGKEEISKKDLFDLCRFKTVDDMESGLNILIERGYVKIIRTKPKGKTCETCETPKNKGGRPKDMIYLNPEARKELK